MSWERVIQTPWGRIGQSSFNHVAIAKTCNEIVRTRHPDDYRGPWCPVCFSEENMIYGRFQCFDLRICIPCALSITALAEDGIDGDEAYWRGEVGLTDKDSGERVTP